MKELVDTEAWDWERTSLSLCDGVINDHPLWKTRLPIARLSSNLKIPPDIIISGFCTKLDQTWILLLSVLDISHSYQCHPWCHHCGHCLTLECNHILSCHRRLPVLLPLLSCLLSFPSLPTSASFSSASSPDIGTQWHPPAHCFARSLPAHLLRSDALLVSPAVPPAP